jgi:hypothetical protein
MRAKVVGAWGLGLLLSLLAPLLLPNAGSAQFTPQAGQKPYKYEYYLPLGGKRLAARGLTFPLPWGVGLNYAWIDQPIKIQDLGIAVNDGKFVDLDGIVKFKSVDASVHALNVRMDFWLFPFLNVYGLANYAAQANTDVRVSDPFEFSAGATQMGGGGGLGTTAAMGAWGFFVTADFNWTRNTMQKLSMPVDTLLFAPRVGRKLFRFGKIELTAWVGTMFQRIGAKTQGKIRLSETIGEPSDELQAKIDDWYNALPPGRQAVVGAAVDALRDALGDDPVIHYKLNKKVSQPWNMLIGTQLELTPNWQIRAEVGFIKRTQIIVGLNYRFGVFKRSWLSPEGAPAAPTAN